MLGKKKIFFFVKMDMLWK